MLSNREGGEQETQPHIGISRIIGWDHRAERRFLLGNKPPSSWMYDCPSLNMPTSLHPQGGFPAEYIMDEGGQGHLTCLDSNHSHFILVDDGTHGHRHVAKSRDWSDAGTSQESGIPQSWRRQGVQLLATRGSLALPTS